MPQQTSSLRIRRHRRIRAKILGTAERPRLAVARSLKHIVVQAIDDTSGRTLVAANDKELKDAARKGKKPIDIAKLVGELIGEKAKAKGISTVVFDRGGYAYHGRVRALAEGARSAGLKF